MTQEEYHVVNPDGWAVHVGWDSVCGIPCEGTSHYTNYEKALASWAKAVAGENPGSHCDYAHLYAVQDGVWSLVNTWDTRPPRDVPS